MAPLISFTFTLIYLRSTSSPIPHYTFRSNYTHYLFFSFLSPFVLPVNLFIALIPSAQPISSSFILVSYHPLFSQCFHSSLYLSLKLHPLRFPQFINLCSACLPTLSPFDPLIPYLYFLLRPVLNLLSYTSAYLFLLLLLLLSLLLLLYNFRSTYILHLVLSFSSAFILPVTPFLTTISFRSHHILSL